MLIRYGFMDLLLIIIKVSRLIKKNIQTFEHTYSLKTWSLTHMAMTVVFTLAQCVVMSLLLAETEPEEEQPKIFGQSATILKSNINVQF